MAEVFKNASVVSVNNSGDSTIYTAPAGTTSIILGVAIANKTGSEVTAKIKLPIHRQVQQPNFYRM